MAASPAHPHQAPPDEPASRQSRPAQPVQVNAGRVIAVGTVIWFVAFVALLPWYGWLGQHSDRDWLWTCLAGWLLGLVGLPLISKHRREGRTR
ncbi:MAG: DUF2530 domain-containing protein [Actinomycetia bacterium]|nr:DUF2530 domain-containing protein [Actinomycetes bacterium]